MSCLVVDCDSFIHTDRYKWRINHSILVNTVTVFLFSFEQLEGCPRKWCQMNRYCHAHLTSDASLTELVFWQIILKVSSQIFDFRFYSMPLQVFDTVAWQGQGCHLLIAFCWVQFFEITSRHINHGADCINLVMQACVNDGKEIVALSFLGCDFTLPLIEKIGLNKVSNLVNLGKTCLHLTVNLVHATATDTIMRSIL